MAEVRLRFVRGAPKVFKSSHFMPFPVGSKHATAIVPVVPVFTLPQLMKIQTDVASIPGSCNSQGIHTNSRTQCFGPGFKRDTSDKRGVPNVSVISQAKSLSDCPPGNVLGNDTLYDGVSELMSESHTLTRAHVVTWINRNGIRPLMGALLGVHGANRAPMRSLHTWSLCGASRSGVGQFDYDRRLMRAYSGTSRNGSHDTPLYKSKTGYYDILEVSPTATQAQIKTAYYKQSFIYHPDKNAGGEGATLRFSQVSEAYNVLGNKTLRKKYDHGILSQADVQGSSRPSSAKETPSKSSGQHTRHSPTHSADSTRVFDFDAFFRAHYGEQLQRERDLRARREEFMKKKEKRDRDWKLGRMTEITLGMIIATAYLILSNLRAN